MEFRDLLCLLMNSDRLYSRRQAPLPSSRLTSITIYNMWKDLTMTQRAGIIAQAIKAGLRDMNSIRKFYDDSLKYADGGPVRRENIKYGKPYYSYDKNMQIETDNGKPILNYSATLPEINIIPDSKKSPADRNADERFRQKTFSDYAEHRDRGYTQGQIARSQNEWNNSTEKKVLQYGQGIASGIGIASDIVSGYPIYSTLKGAAALDKAKKTNKVADYAEAGLWLLPGGVKMFKTLNNAGKVVPSISESSGLSNLRKEELEREIEKLRAIRRIHGYPEDVNLSGINDFADNVTTGLSQEAKEGLRRGTIDRNVRAIRQDYTTSQRIKNPSNNHILEDLESIERGYRKLAESGMENVKVGRYSAEDYLLAVEEGTGGSYNGARNFISLNEGSKNALKVEKHEGRHLIDRATNHILTPRQEEILQAAYDSDFTQLPYVSRYDFLEGYKNMGSEKVTTNRDARDALLKQLKRDYKLESIPDLATEDKLISTAVDGAIFDAVEEANGYGWAYMDWLRHIGEATPAKAQLFREAMKHVGGVAAPITVGATLSNQYAKGGNISNKYPLGGLLPAMPIEATRQLTKQRLYNNITPRTYYKPINRVYNAVVNNESDLVKYGTKINAPTDKDVQEQLDNIWATYLQIPDKRRKVISNKNKLVNNGDGSYSLGHIGTIYDTVMEEGLGYDKYIDYKGNGNLHHFYQPPMKLGEHKLVQAGDVYLGDYTVSRGYDSNGEYIQYNDVWDINPFKKTHEDFIPGQPTNLYGQSINPSISEQLISKTLADKEDASLGLGKPIKIKGKFYLNDYYGVDRSNKSTYLPEVTITGKRKGKVK